MYLLWFCGAGRQRLYPLRQVSEMSNTSLISSLISGYESFAQMFGSCWESMVICCSSVTSYKSILLKVYLWDTVKTHSVLFIVLFGEYQVHTSQLIFYVHYFPYEYDMPLTRYPGIKYMHLHKKRGVRAVSNILPSSITQYSCPDDQPSINSPKDIRLLESDNLLDSCLRGSLKLASLRKRNTQIAVTIRILTQEIKTGVVYWIFRLKGSKLKTIHFHLHIFILLFMNHNCRWRMTMMTSVRSKYDKESH